MREVSAAERRALRPRRVRRRGRQSGREIERARVEHLGDKVASNSCLVTVARYETRMPFATSSDGDVRRIGQPYEVQPLLLGEPRLWSASAYVSCGCAAVALRGSSERLC